MTTDIKKLIERLRVAEVGEVFQAEDGSPEPLPTELGLDAADALEAMAGEVGTVRSARDMHHANYELMKAHNKELFGKLSAAEAERDRLKAAITTHVAGCVACGGSGVVAISTWDHIAEPSPETCEECGGLREALGGDAS